MARRLAFTLVELLVVLGILGTLLALTVPAIQRVRGTLDRVACLGKLRTLGRALAEYHAD